jgi:hypothetical protein
MGLIFVEWALKVPWLQQAKSAAMTLAASPIAGADCP